MAKGNVAKQEITDKILKTFDGAFIYNGGKEIRIPFVENGEQLQIKCVLTCSKSLVNAEAAAPAPAATSREHFVEITEDEKQEVDNLISRLGL